MPRVYDHYMHIIKIQQVQNEIHQLSDLILGTRLYMLQGVAVAS